MIIKGKSQHVMPDAQGWSVIDEGNQSVIQHFATREEAVAHAQHSANACEGTVLIHETHCDPSELPTVSLPQREMLSGNTYSQASIEDAPSRQTRDEKSPDAPELDFQI